MSHEVNASLLLESVEEDRAQQALPEVSRREPVILNRQFEFIHVFLRVYLTVLQVNLVRSLAVDVAALLLVGAKFDARLVLATCLRDLCGGGTLPLLLLALNELILQTLNVDALLS